MIVLVLFVVSLILRAGIAIHYGFAGLYGQDPFAYYQFAQDLRIALLQGEAIPPFFWSLGYPALLAGGFSLFGVSAFTAQAINLVLGAALTPLVYQLARQLGAGLIGGLIAALIMTICGQALQSSVVVMADIPALFWATLSAVLLTRSEQTRFTLFLSAITLAIAGVSRWIYLALIVPWAIWTLIGWQWRVKVPEIAIVAIGATLIFVPQLLYSQTNPYPALNHPWVEGWRIEHALQREFSNPDGTFQYEQINALYYARPVYDPYYLAPIFAPIGLLGLIRRDRRLAILLLWLLLPYLFLIGIPYQNIRFPLIVMPAVAIAVGIGADRLYGLAQSRRIVIPLLGLSLVLAIGMSLSAAQVGIDRFIRNQQRDQLTALWVRDQLPAGATLYTFGITLSIRYYHPAIEVIEIFYETPETLAARPSDEAYLLLNVYNIETQWDGRGPQIVYHWLRRERGLYEIARYGYYTLFEIER